MFEIAKQGYEMEFSPPIIYISDNPNDVYSDYLSYTVSVDNPYPAGVVFYHASGGKFSCGIFTMTIKLYLHVTIMEMGFSINTGNVLIL